MIEAELAFAFEIEQILSVMENLVKFALSRIFYHNSIDWGLYTEQNVELQVNKIESKNFVHKKNMEISNC